MTRRDEVEVAWGYTLGHLHAIAIHATQRAPAGPTSFDGRVQAAFDGAVDHLLEATSKPTTRDLDAAAHIAIRDHINAEAHHHGYSTRRPDAGMGTMGGFTRYWTPLPRDALEERIVEQLALTQIVPQLPPSQRDALDALAMTGDHARGARLAGMTDQQFRMALSRGRAKFKALWHEGETPSRLWMLDRGGPGRGPIAAVRRRPYYRRWREGRQR
jgi:hypothetical protein